MFRKFKHGKYKKRMIWTTPDMEKILWGDESKKNIKGFLMTSELQELNEGMRWKMNVIMGAIGCDAHTVYASHMVMRCFLSTLFVHCCE